MKVLPEGLRDMLKGQMGRLVDEKTLIDILKNESRIVSIGDQVTYTILKNDIEPFFCIVDYHTRRGVCEEEIVDLIKSYAKKAIGVKNPMGTISDDLWKVIESAFEELGSGGLRIEVEGEEDLASLAVIYLAPSDVTIIYGLPDKGVLVVKPTNDNKAKVKEVLDMM